MYFIFYLKIYNNKNFTLKSYLKGKQNQHLNLWTNVGFQLAESLKKKSNTSVK